MRLSIPLFLMGCAYTIAAYNDLPYDTRYSEQLMVGTHNSPFIGDGPSANQIMSAEAQLSSGARFLTVQTRKSISGEIQLCHTSCVLLNAGKLTDFLTAVKA
jgi:hypothetical protein